MRFSQPSPLGKTPQMLYMSAMVAAAWLGPPNSEAARGRLFAPISPSASSRKELGDSLTVEQRTLTPLVKVRILVPQPMKSKTYD